MGPIAVDAVLLRGLLPELSLRAGQLLPGRVLERTGRHGLLNLAGAVLVAELPDEVQPGQRLRLSVQEVRDEQVVLRVVPEQQQPGASGHVPAPPPGGSAGVPFLPLPLPGDRYARARARADAQGTVSVDYESPELGRIELRIAGGAALVLAPAGPALELATERLGELRDALTRALGRPVDVRLAPRRLDVSA